MANFSSLNFKKKGAEHLQANGNALALAVDVLKSDTYAQAMTKAIANTALSGDISLLPNGNDLQITVNGKNIDPTATADVADDLVILVLDSVNEEVIICNDAVDRGVTNEDGDTVTTPPLILNIRELSAA